MTTSHITESKPAHWDFIRKMVPSGIVIFTTIFENYLSFGYGNFPVKSLSTVSDPV